MKPESWQRLNEIFDQVAELPAAEREERVRRACADDPELLEEALALVGQADRVEDEFLDRPLADRALSLLESDRRRERLGQQVGSWRLAEEIGSGGMGVVYRAERVAGGFRQQGALKMVAGLPGRELLRRFSDERQMLARLTHPGIARLLDGGATDDGSPYLVMEYVEGETITDYCERRRLTVEERIDLVLAICAAVQSAHQSLIIHRDLKPSNILVDAEGEPKLLDFGIAKLLDPAGESAGLTAAPALTPEYASPEQLENRPVSTASDVFSLGVLLYELLTGHRPFGAPGSPMVEISRRMHAGPPAPPSSVVLRSEPAGAIVPREVGRSHRSTPKSLRRRLAGDLDAILLKALRVEPEHRYATVEALAEELRRERDGLPVQARGEALSYRVSRFAHRHRVALASALLVAISLLAATVFSFQQARTAVRERDKAARISGFLQRMISAPDASWFSAGKTGRDVTVVQVLTEAERSLDEEDLQATEEAGIRRTLGTTYRGLGLYDEATALLREAVRLDRLTGPRSRELAVSLHELGGTHYFQGEYDKSADLYRQAIDIFRALPGEPDEEMIKAIQNLGLLLQQRGDLDEAEPYLREALAMNRERAGDVHPISAIALANLGNIRLARGDLEGAGALYQRTLDTLRQLPGTTWEPAVVLHNLALVDIFSGRSAEAEARLDEAMTIATDKLGEDHPHVASIRLGRALSSHRRGDLPTAEREARVALEIQDRFLAEDHPHRARSWTILGRIQTARGQSVEAEPLIRQALELRQGALPGGDWRIAESAAALGECLAAQERWAEAEPLLVEAAAGLRATLGSEHVLTRETEALSESARRQRTTLGGPAPE